MRVYEKYEDNMRVHKAHEMVFFMDHIALLKHYVTY